MGQTAEGKREGSFGAAKAELAAHRVVDGGNLPHPAPDPSIFSVQRDREGGDPLRENRGEDMLQVGWKEAKKPLSRKGTKCREEVTAEWSAGRAPLRFWP